MKKYAEVICVIMICLSVLNGCERTRLPYLPDNANEGEFIYSNTTLLKIRETYGGDLDSSFAIFPDESLITEDHAVFETDFHYGLFDTDARMILKLSLTPEQFDSEIQRLSKLKMVISQGKLAYTNLVEKDNESYALPAYITIDGFGNTYEYALINEAEYKITYVYLAYPNIEKLDKSLLKKDLSTYKADDTSKLYSMYNHSFDGGSSFTEYNDPLSPSIFAFEPGRYMQKDYDEARIDSTLPYLLFFEGNFNVINDVAVDYQPSGEIRNEAGKLVLESEFAGDTYTWVFELIGDNELKYTATESEPGKFVSLWKDGMIFKRVED